MIIFVPILILLAAGFTMFVMQRVRPSFGFAWLTAAIGAAASWLTIFVIRLKLPGLVFLAKWEPQTLFVSSPALLLDRYSWPYAFGLATLTLVVILTVPARMTQSTTPYTWASSLIVSGLGLLAIQAGNPYTLMVAWTIIDLVELVILLKSASDEHNPNRIILSFATRVGGTMILAWAVLTGEAQSETFTLTGLPVDAGLFVLLAAGLRLGVLPFILPFRQELNLPRGLGTLLRVVPAVSTLALLTRLPASSVPENWVPFLSGFAVLAVVYCGVAWLGAKDELSGRPFWLLGCAGMAIICVINGNPDSSLAWGTALLLPGGLIFLFSAREPRLLAFPILSLWGLAGLPFSPAAAGWQGIVGSGFRVDSAMILLGHILLISGYLRHALRPEASLESVERWGQIVYPIGLLILILVDLVIGVWGWPGSLTVGVWWAGMTSSLLAASAGWLWMNRRRIYQKLGLTEIDLRQAIPAWLTGRIADIFRLDWLYNLVWMVYRGAGRIVNGLTTITEGDGGVLWTLVLLALLMTFLAQGGAK